MLGARCNPSHLNARTSDHSLKEFEQTERVDASRRFGPKLAVGGRDGIQEHRVHSSHTVVRAFLIGCSSKPQNVVGARPTGWWRDRAAAASQLVERIRAAIAALPG